MAKWPSRNIQFSGMEIGTTIIKTIRKCLKKLTKTTIWSTNSIYGYSSKENENTNSKKFMHTYAHCCIIHNSQEKETT